jgi:hypothetical protein
MTEMFAPLRWRNKGYMLNPNINGYRPDCFAQSTVVSQKEYLDNEITDPGYYRKSEDQNVRNVVNYSEILKPEVSIEEVSSPKEIETECQPIEKPIEIIVYQSDRVMAEV